jgi:hypothetical protein
MASVNDFSIGDIVHLFEVRNFQIAHSLYRRVERVVGTAFTVLLAQVLSRSAQNTQDLRTVESLSFTMLAEAHGRLSPR